MSRLLFSSIISAALALASAAQVPVGQPSPPAVTVPSIDSASVSAGKAPNVILIVADDLGYADLGSFGSKTVRTPNLDRMAAEGRKFTSFYVAQAVCSASRAAFMTGCYANRVSMQGALNHTSLEGIHPDEFLMPEMFKKHGYATAAYGKWHLGTADLFHPMKNGFDEFWGIPYSNDNSKFHPSLAAEMPPLPLYEDEKVVQTDPDQSQFTRRITEKAVGFIRRHKNEPFFLYVPQIMPHVPIFASERFKGKSPHGLYADVVEELDWSVGMMLAAVEQAGLDENTLIVFFSDNGPFLSYGNHAGSAAPYREGKLTSYEGGVRVPCLVRWKGRIKPGTETNELLTAMDLLPTFARLVEKAGTSKTATIGPADSGFTTPVATPPVSQQAPDKSSVAEIAGSVNLQPGSVADDLKSRASANKKTLSGRRLDGKDVTPLLLGHEGAKSPHEAIAIYAGGELQAIRSGDWKLHFAHPYITPHESGGRDGKPANWENMKPAAITQSGIQGIATRHGYKVEQQAPALYNLKENPGENQDVSAANPEIVNRLTALAAGFREELGDSLTQTKGSQVRPLGLAKSMKGE